MVLVLALVWFAGFARAGRSHGEEEDGMSSAQVSPVLVESSDQPAPAVGQAAPQFTARTVGGEDVSIESLRGKPTWLVFNATSCANCRAETPDVQEAYQPYGDESNILSIYVSDTPSAVLEYSEKLGLTFPQVFDGQNLVAALYRVMGLPTHYFLDADGLISAIEVGTLSASQIERHLQEAGLEMR